MNVGVPRMRLEDLFQGGKVFGVFAQVEILQPLHRLDGDESLAARLAAGVGECQPAQDRLLRRPLLEIEGAEVAGQLGCRPRGIADNAGEILRRLAGTRTPDDVPIGRGGSGLAADFLEPGAQVSVPLLIGADAQRFKVPAVRTIVLPGQLGPKRGRLGRLVVPQGDGRVAADLRPGRGAPVLRRG